MARHSARGRRWDALRAVVLSRDKHTCQACGARGRLEIDHIEPVSLAPARRFDPSNLQALCIPCHVAKTEFEQGRGPLSEARRAWREAVRALARVPNRAARKDTLCSNP